MKNVIYYFAAITVAVLAFSCQKSIENEAPVEHNQKVQTFKAIFPSDKPDSKVSLDVLGKTGWEIGDVITIHGKKTSEIKTVTLDGVTNTISADGKTATFSVALDMTADDYGTDGFYAAYPHSAFTEYDSVNDENRTRYFNSFNNTNHLLLSGVYNGSDAFVFYNVTGALSFVVDGSSFGGFDEYIIVGKNNETIGFDHFNTRVATGNISFYHYSSTGPKKTVRGDVEDDGTSVNYVFFPVTEANDTDDVLGKRAKCVDFTNGFIIYFLKGGSITHMASTSASVSIERQSLTNLGDITSHIKAYTPPATHNSSIKPVPSDVSDENLSNTGSANCYIIDGSDAANKNKIFKFKAVKGNSSTVLSTIESAVLIWETYNNATDVTANSVIAAVDYDLQEGGDPYIVFKMPNPETPLQAGNALIAAKDGTGKIIWSWHIWIPKSLPTADTYGFSASITMLDRNIGALDAPTAGSAEAQNAGLFYQWGRKDPLRAVSSIADGTLAKTYPTGIWTSSSTQLTAANMHESPCVFIKGSEDWIAVSDKTLWAETKTINDPCPIGYKVPKRNETGFFDYLTPSASNPGWSVNDSNYNFTINGAEGAVAVFPYGHFSRGGSYDLSDGRAWIWTATNKSDSEMTLARTMVLPSAVDKLDCSGQKKANGVYVRCVAE